MWSFSTCVRVVVAQHGMERCCRGGLAEGRGAGHIFTGVTRAREKLLYAGGVSFTVDWCFESYMIVTHPIDLCYDEKSQDISVSTIWDRSFTEKRSGKNLHTRFLLVTLHVFVRKCLFTNYSSFLRYLIFWYLISMISTMFVVIWKCVGLLALLYYWLYIQWRKMTIISLIAIIYEAIYRNKKLLSWQA